MDAAGPPPLDTDPRYNLINASRVSLPAPPLLSPDSNPFQANQFLRDFFASIHSLPSDHLFIQDLARRFMGDGQALCSKSRNKLRHMFGSSLGQRLDRTLAGSKYGWRAHIDYYLCIAMILFIGVGTVNGFSGIWTGGRTNFFLWTFSVYGTIVVRSLLRAYINSYNSIKAPEFFIYRSWNDSFWSISEWRDHILTTTVGESMINPILRRLKRPGECGIPETASE